MKILIVSDSPLLTTGYGGVVKKLGEIFLSMGCEVQQIAWGLHQEVDYIYKLHPTPLNDFGKSIFAKVVEDFIPSIVISYGDLFNVAWISMYKNKFFKHWCYFPVDADKLTKTQAMIINQLDLPIVYSRSALYAVTLDTPRLDTKLIYHGVDTEKFKPVEDKDKHKTELGFANKFIVGTVGRNCTRKNFPALISAFAKFAKDKNDVLLYLHTKPKDFAGHNLYEFISEHEIADKVVITKDLDSTKGISIEELNKVYNCFDIFVSSTSGEGLNMPLLESQLCEVPTLVTDYSACKEFVPKNLRIPVKAYYYEGFQWDVKRAIIDEDELISKLNFYYYNREILPMIGKQCREYVQNWDWQFVEPLWKNLLIHNGAKDQNVLSDFIKI